MTPQRFVFGIIVATLAACSQPESLEPDAPRVFFVGLQDGDEVGSPLDLEFGSHNFRIEKAGDGMINPGAGHFHLGVGARCLPERETIPTAAPWTHFTDGSNTIELDLAPGKHTLVLQAGDGAHRTLSGRGLCQEIEIHVTPEAETP